MKKTYTQSAEEVLSGLGVGAAGLTTAQAKERLEQYGPNKLKEAHPPAALYRAAEGSHAHHSDDRRRRFHPDRHARR